MRPFYIQKTQNGQGGIIMFDFTPLVEALIGLAATAVTVFLIPWLKARYGNEVLEKARGWVQIGVLAAEKVYGAGNGDEKLAYVTDFLAQHKIKLDIDTLKALVNAEIKKMEQAEVVVEDVLLEHIPPDGE